MKQLACSQVLERWCYSAFPLAFNIRLRQMQCMCRSAISCISPAHHPSGGLKRLPSASPQGDVVTMISYAPCHLVPEPGVTARQAQQAEPMAETEAVAQALQPTDVILIVLIAVVVFYLLPRQARHCALA